MRVIDAWRYEDMKGLQAAARGDIQADLAIVNCRLVNVLTMTVYAAEIYVKNGVIVHIEDDPGTFMGKAAAAECVYDAQGAYLAPGFMDAHVHCESSMLTPYYFGRAIALQGTTSAFTDPHELANVAGKGGVKYMLENGKKSPVRQFVLVPSCVPAVPGLESAGAAFGASEISEIALWDRECIVGLAEVMDYINVINGGQRMSDVLDAATKAGLYLQSHYYQTFGRPLSSYLVRGMGGNHELRTSEELIEVLRKGGWVNIKGASSISDAFEKLLDGIRRFPHPESLQVSLCTDDVHARDILEKGHVNRVMNRMIVYGFDPLLAIAYGTRNTAVEYGIANLGSVKVGNIADLVIFPDLEEISPSAVFVGGSLIVDEGKLLAAEEPAIIEPDEGLCHIMDTMRMSRVNPSDLLIRAMDSKAGTAKVNVIDFEDKITELFVEELPVRDGVLDISERPDLAFAAVFNRYGTGSYTFAVVKNFQLGRGAVASTVSHDSHNMTVVYRSPSDAASLINALIDCHGGIGAKFDEKMVVVELPVGGLMSKLSPESLAYGPLSDLRELYDEIFTVKDVSLLKPVSISLIVSPKFKISDMGIVGVLKQEFVPLFPE